MKRLFRFPWRTKRHIETETEAELRFHIDARTEALMAQGSGLSEARAQAMREFGDMEDARRYINAVDREAELNRRRKDFMGDFVQDITYAVRKLRTAPVFAITCILTLSVGIGANSAVFNLINAVLYKPPAVHEPSRMAWIAPHDKRGRFGGWSLPDLNDYRSASKSWSGVAAFSGIDVTIGGDVPLHVNGQITSANYFDVLGIAPRPGRGFAASEDSSVANASPVVLGYEFWHSHFNGDSAAIGQTIEVNSHSMTIVGVAPEGFNGMRIGDVVAVYVPLSAIDEIYGRRAADLRDAGSRWLSVVGRLAPAATYAAAETEAVTLSTHLETTVRNADERRTLGLVPVRGGLDPGARNKVVGTLALLSLVPLFVLGIACANVANLFVARSVQRTKEIAVRRALGASRGRLVRQLLTECAVLGVAAAVAGMGMSYAITAVVIRVGDFPQDIVSILHPDMTVLVATLILSIGAGALFGLAPSLAATGNAITPSLKNDGIAPTSGGVRHRLRNAFVVSQVALSLSLLITAGLFVGSLQKALTVDPGFDPHNAASAMFDLAAQGYDSSRARAYVDALTTRLDHEPGVKAVTMANVLPLSGNAHMTDAVGGEAPRGTRGYITHVAEVAPTYFSAMRVPLVKGRAFNDRDTRAAPRVVIVNERLASLVWPGQDPIGRLIRVGGDSMPLTVVGMAKNGKYRTLAEDSPEACAWMPTAQGEPMLRGVVMVRSDLGTDAAIQALKRAFAAVDPGVPPFRLNTLEHGIAQTVDGQRGAAAMLGLSGLLAVALAALGIFGVIAQGVAARTREIGIRMSLGARGADVVRGFVREGLVLTLVGAGIGIALSLGLSKVLSSLLFGLTSTDIITFAGASAALIAVAAFASFVPARRAAKVDPLVALRSD